MIRGLNQFIIKNMKVKEHTMLRLNALKGEMSISDFIDHLLDNYEDKNADKLYIEEEPVGIDIDGTFRYKSLNNQEDNV